MTPNPLLVAERTKSKYMFIIHLITVAVGINQIMIGSYLFGCSALFFVIANYSENKYEWMTLSALFLCLFFNKLIFSATSDYLYYSRSFMSFFAVRLFLLKNSKFGLYQSFIQMLVLSAYCASAFDVANDRHILIYNNYKAIMHGLVACIFVGVIPELWNNICNIVSVGLTRYKHYKRV